MTAILAGNPIGCGGERVQVYSAPPAAGVAFEAKDIAMNRLAVLTMFSWQYLLMAFLACLGIVQMAAVRSGRRHLWLLRRHRSTAALGCLLLVAGVAFFYLIPLVTAGPWGPADPIQGSATWSAASPVTLTAARNVNETAGGLTGYWQALWFSLGWIAAVFFARAVGRFHYPKPAQNRVREQKARADVGGRR
jgi:hypothetical protein